MLVPGFAGFDALGQLEYYAGVTPQFRAWKKSGINPHAPHAVLHYFDNFPTASVATRARRLRDYLAKRIARGEFLDGDKLALVGHSTGGLDIRRLLYDLARDVTTAPHRRYSHDGIHGGQFAVSPRTILQLIDRVVFLSVPQWGTNIADWVRTYASARLAIITELRASVAASQVPIVDRLQGCISNWVAGLSNEDLLYALGDTLSEAEPDASKDPLRTALAQEAASEVELWLRHMATDFGAIEDLAVQAPGHPTSPAHFGSQQRKREIAYWKPFRIKTRSYATLGKSPFRFDSGGTAPRWDLLNPFTYPEVTKDSALSTGTDLVYRTCYRACAGGPFAFPSDPAFVPVATHLGSSKQQRIEIWDNDGIVNTASMLWPDGKATLLVECDHMDIVGHYRRARTESKPTGRRYEAYDLLKSASRFHEPEFEQVWRGVFDFCVS